MTLEHVIGIDGGGTHTRVMIAAVDGSWTSFGQSGCSNLQHAGWQGCEFEIGQAISAAYSSNHLSSSVMMSDCRGLFLGLAGVTSEGDRSQLRNLLRGLGFSDGCAIDVHHDIASALAGGLAGAPGIALIAGTGSSCYGRNERGEDFRCGGWGALVDDVGGAYWIGKRALEIAVRQEDRRVSGNAIRNLVADFLGIKSYDDFLGNVHSPRMTREQIAKLSPLVEALAEEGDLQAGLILDEAVDLLTELVVTTLQQLGMKESQLTLTGSVANAKAIRPKLIHSIASAMLSIEVVEAKYSPVCGSVIEARRLAGLPNTPELLEFLNS